MQIATSSLHPIPFKVNQQHQHPMIILTTNGQLRCNTTSSEHQGHKVKSKGLPNSSKPLGHPLPLDEHACSVSLPTWSSVVGYEEGSPQVTEKLACGYPRFVYHPYIIRLMEVSLEIDERLQGQTDGEEKWDCLVLPSRESALRCHDFLVKACGYLDGRAASPRLVDSNLSQIIGNARIPLFSPDNAIDNNDDSNDCYNPMTPIRVLDLNVSAGVHAVIFPAQTAFAIEAKSYWQHTGEVLSSRRAEAALNELKMCSGNDKSNGDNNAASNSSNIKYLPRVTSSFHHKDCHDELKDCWKKCPHTNEYHLALYSSEENNDLNDPYDGIKDRIASIVGTPSSHVFLTPSGMASIYAALRASRRREISMSQHQSGGGASVVFGFPYLDTLKMCSRPELVPDGVEFFGHGSDQDLSNLEQMLKDRKEKNKPGVSVLITEFPSNPLLNCPDLHKLRSLADEYDFAVVVDDTIGNFANLDLIESGLADVVCTSLTKLFNGRGDAMAGSVITNPNTKIGQWLQRDLQENHHNHEGLWAGDAYAVNANSTDFLSRSSQINETTEALADWLKERDEVAAVYYPKYTSPAGYNSCLNKSDFGGQHKPGYGGLFSILLHPHICQRTFYDKLDLSKGPSLGTDFSLVCPYTLLAHYHELDFAMSYDVQPNLLRFAIGLEDLELLQTRFTSAFEDSKLHPKLPTKPSVGNDISRGYCTFSHAYPRTNNWNGVRQPWNIGNGLLGCANRVKTHRESTRSRGMHSFSLHNSSWNDLNYFNLRLVQEKAWRQNARTLCRIITIL